MNLQRLVVSCSLLTLSACATLRPPVVGGATLTGVLDLPTGPDDSVDCAAVAVDALVAGDPTPVGRASVHAGGQRCLYTVSDVPPGVPVSLVPRVTSNGGCAHGAQPAFQPPVAPLTLLARQTVTRDFRISCATVGAGGGSGVGRRDAR